jgi:predicted metal-dependent TIM-barrel fold hydrolase
MDRERLARSDAMESRLVDAHAHLNMLTWTDLEAMHLAGIEQIVSPIMLDAAKPVCSETIVEMWDYLLEVQLQRAGDHFIRAYGMVCVNMASTPKGDPAPLFTLLPAYLARPEVVAIGEIGLEPQSRTCRDLTAQSALLEAQFEISKATGTPVVIHTPHAPEAKRHFTGQVLALSTKHALPMAQVVFDHCSEANIGVALDAGAYAAVSVQPWRGMTPEFACDLIARYGVDRIMINSDCSGQHSDPLAVPKTAAALRRRGLPEADIGKVCGANAVVFFGI